MLVNHINKLKVLSIIVLIFIFFIAGYILGQGNQRLNYGSYGFPKNCRALIAENLWGIDNGQYTSEEALNSIRRNCGPDGLTWLER